LHPPRRNDTTAMMEILQRSLDEEEMEDYSFFVSYSTGFALFVSLALIVGLVMFCLTAWQLWTDKSSFTLPACLLLLLVSTACLAWISAHRPYQRDHEEPPYKRVWGFLVLVPAMMLALVGLWLPLKNLPTAALYVFSSCFWAIPGLVLLAMYCKLMETSENFTYHGPMYITGYIVETKTFVHTTQYSGTDEYSRYYGMPKVTWGGEWGCPSDPTIWCETYVVDDQCEFCDPDGIGCHTGTVSDAERCAQQKYEKNTNSTTLLCILDRAYGRSSSGRSTIRRQPQVDRSYLCLGWGIGVFGALAPVDGEAFLLHTCPSRSSAFTCCW
jgi:hypothetical protein